MARTGAAIRFGKEIKFLQFAVNNSAAITGRIPRNTSGDHMKVSETIKASDS